MSGHAYVKRNQETQQYPSTNPNLPLGDPNQQQYGCDRDIVSQDMEDVTRNTDNMRSTTGYRVFLRGKLVVQKSRRQSNI